MPVTPLQAALDVLDRAEALLKLDRGTETVKLVEYDIRRQALAMGVAALDTWMHWAIRRVELDDLSSRLGALEIPFSALVEMGQRSVEARVAGRKDKPGVRARNVLNEKLLTMTFQSGRQWDIGFQMLGIGNGLTLTARALAPSLTRAAVETRLNALSHRRNCVVHEGDLVRQIRPRRIERSRLLRPSVDDDLAWIRSFVTAADGVVR